jgi:uncharacterized membrane protein
MQHQSASRLLSLLAWALVAIYATVSLSRIAPAAVPIELLGPIAVLMPFLFAFIHGSLQYRLRDAVVFAVACLVISNIFENVSILTGFPFGNYHYSGLVGPKLFLVPLLIGPAYLGMGYLSWTLARIILGSMDNMSVRVLGLPLVASVLMVSWDLTFDPWASTLSRNWIWHDGGSYFGVPFSNFLGWYLTVYVFFQLFALYLWSKVSVAVPRKRTLAPSLWWSAVTMYGITALQPVLRFWVPTPHAATVTDEAGIIWNVYDIYASGALISLFTMVAFTLLATLKLTDMRRWL